MWRRGVAARLAAHALVKEEDSVLSVPFDELVHTPEDGGALFPESLESTCLLAGVTGEEAVAGSLFVQEAQGVDEGTAETFYPVEAS